MNMSLVLRPPRQIQSIFAEPLQMSQPAILFRPATKPSRFAHFWKGAESLAPATQNDASTSKSGASMWCFEHSDFDMCFAPQRRTLFEHINFQTCSERSVLCTFLLRDVLRATTFNISTSKSGPNPSVFNTFGFQMCFAPQPRALFKHLNKVVRTCQFLTLLTSKCASRHHGVHFLISHLARLLRTRRFSEPTFRPSGTTNHWKNTVNRDFYTFFAHLHLLSSDSFSSLIFSLLLFSSLTLPPLLFHLSILSEVWLLNFLRSQRRWLRFGTVGALPHQLLLEDLSPSKRSHFAPWLRFRGWGSSLCGSRITNSPRRMHPFKKGKI